MKLLPLILVALCLSGCAGMQNRAELDRSRASIDSYVAQNLDRTKSGEMKWSDYYEGLYDLFKTSSFTDRGFIMQRLVVSIETAEKYERGEITTEEFSSFRRKQEADMTAHYDQKREDAARLEAMRPVAPPYIPPPVSSPQPIRQPLNCTSNRVGNQVYTNCY